MPVPGALYLECDACGDITLHEVVHGKVSGKKLQLQVRCRECGTRSEHLREEVATSHVPVVISEGERSHRTKVEIESDDVILLGDELLVDGIPVQVRGIEVGTDQRVDSAPVRDIKTLWTVRFDKVVVKFSINMGHMTKAGSQVASPDEEFTVGEMVQVKGVTAVIHRIKTWDRTLQRGSAEARDIRRIYGKAVRRSR
ncbi:MAG: hypothetical protein JSW25_02000 [Thermoplasmata archaeon]|nr:MAG: hypothetical protein JSW25_02000 [Thermoplasmata archaeon]